MSQLISGYTRIEQILYFFEQNQTGTYSAAYIAQYLLNTFDFSNKKNPISGLTIPQQVYQEVSGKLAELFNPEDYAINVQMNMDRIRDTKHFLYYFYPNKNLVLPKVKYSTRKNKYTNTHSILPKQQEFTYETVLPNKTTNQLKFDLFTDDSQAFFPFTDTINIIKNVNIPKDSEITFKRVIDGKTITVIVANN